MRRRLIVVAAGAWAVWSNTGAVGGVTLLSDARSVSISVTAEGLVDPTASDGFFAQPAGPFAVFDVPTTTRTASTSEAFARASASQSSAATPDEVRFAGAVFGDARGDSLAGVGTVIASSNAQIGFAVDVPTDVRIRGTLTPNSLNTSVSIFRGDSTLFGVASGAGIDQTITLEPGSYSAAFGVWCVMRQSSTTGSTDSASVDVTLTFSPAAPACPCVADFDQSGGTPDATDIDAFFAAWLAGDPSADSDCSGGTPDATDIDGFFSQWLAGGC